MADEEATPTIESPAPEAATKRPFSLLASERFGSQYTGEVPEKPDATEEPPEAEQPEEAAEAATEDPPTETEASEETEGEVTISSVQELIEANEYDPEWFNSLQVPIKVDGKTDSATLSDLVKSYQMGEAAEKRLEDAKSKAKTLNQELTQKSEALQGQFATVAKLIENAEAMLDQDTSAIDWTALRQDDPAEYSAKKTEVAERRERIDQLKREAAETWQQTTQRQQQEQQGTLAERIAQEQKLLHEKIPEWQDEQKATEGKKKVVEYLLGQGFSQDDLQGASDHRLIVMSRKAMLYDEMQANSNVAKKKVAKVPKVLKPGAPKPREFVKQEQKEKARARFHSTGKIEDAFKFLKTAQGR